MFLKKVGQYVLMEENMTGSLECTENPNACEASSRNGNVTVQMAQLAVKILRWPSYRSFCCNYMTRFQQDINKFFKALMVDNLVCM